MPNVEPRTRSVEAVVEAIQIVEAELEFQVGRLGTIVGRTPLEADHLADLQQGYGDAARYLRILRNYHMGRLERKLLTGSLGLAAPVTVDGFQPTVVDEE